MGIYKQSSNSKGSLKLIQKLVNYYPAFLNEKINGLLRCEDNIIWLSPLSDDENGIYSEYRDSDFLLKLGLGELIEDLSQFWPRNGPQWDGLGRSGNNVFLIEAKANLPELISRPCGAKSRQSIDSIQTSLNNTKEYMTHIPIEANWMGKYYQYTNRLSHLYFLREHGVNAYLVFIYFIGDVEVQGPASIDEWIVAKKQMEFTLNIPDDHKLKAFILDLFIDVNELNTEGKEG